MTPHSFSARASVGGYLALSGIWFALSAGFASVRVLRHTANACGASVLSLLVGLLWVIWLKGFRLCISRDQITYRDGMYRQYSGRVVDVVHIETTWIEWGILSKTFKVPRVVLSLVRSGRIG